MLHCMLHTYAAIRCAPPPDDCTGVPEIDAVLKASDIGCKMGLGLSNEVVLCSTYYNALHAMGLGLSNEVLLCSTLFVSVHLRSTTVY